MDRIIFFDIDKTLFDRDMYLNGFFNLLETNYNLSNNEVQHVRDFYEEVKKEYGYFANQAFLVKTYERFPDLSDKLNYYFEPENLSNFFFEDAKVLFEIKNARIGIFSKGDINLQAIKIKKFENVIEPSLIYIFHNKLEELSMFLEKHKDSEIFLVDDNITILVNAKDLNKKVVTILIDRKGREHDINGIDFKINSLSDIMPILNEKS